MQTQMILSLGLVFCLCGVIYGYSDCGSETGEILTVEISGCAQSSKRCILKRNTNATLQLNFIPKVDSNSVTAIVHGVILGVPVPFDLPNADGCKDSGVSCPVKAGQTYKYITSMPIKSEYPRVTVDIKWELQDPDKKDIVCALIPSKIA